MLINKDTNPLRDVYYLGAKVLDVISIENTTEIEFFRLFELLKKREKISMNLFALTLDWLFIIGVIESMENGNIKKCF